MNLRLQSRLLTATSLALASGSVLALGWACFAPVAPIEGLDRNVIGGSAAASEDRAASDTLDLAAPCWSRPLQGPRPEDSVAAAAPTEASSAESPSRIPPEEMDEPPRLDFTLLGIATERGESRAIIASVDETDVCGVGEALDLEPAGVIVKEIREDAIVLSLNGTDQLLTLE